MKSTRTPPTRPQSVEPQEINTPVIAPQPRPYRPMSPIDPLPPTYEQVLSTRQTVIQPRGPMLPPGGAQMSDEVMLGRGMGRGRSL